MDIKESPSTIQMFGECQGGEGPDLRSYPNLVYAPNQWGEGVRIASNGVLAEAVGTRASTYPLDESASYFSVTLHEAFDALRYVKDNGMA